MNGEDAFFAPRILADERGIGVRLACLRLGCGMSGRSDFTGCRFLRLLRLRQKRGRTKKDRDGKRATLEFHFISSHTPRSSAHVPSGRTRFARSADTTIPRMWLTT